MSHDLDDPRVARSKRAVLEATMDLLAEEGFGAMAIETIAARAGVAKTTVYRHWPDRTALLVDAVKQLAACEELPRTGDARSDLVKAMIDLNDRFHMTRYGKSLPAIIAAAEHDPDLAAALNQHASERRRMLTQRLLEGVRKGDLPAGIDPERVQAMLVGAVMHRRIFVRRPYRPAEIVKLVDSVLTAAAVAAPGHAATA